MKIPNLVPIDLGKADRHDHPDIKTDGTWYLVQYDGSFHAGLFEREFDDLTLHLGGEEYEAIYFNAPGWNNSKWEAVWELLP